MGGSRMPLWLLSIVLRVRGWWNSLTPIGKGAVIKWAVLVLFIAANLVLWTRAHRRDVAQRARIQALALEAANITARLDTLRRLSTLSHDDSVALNIGDSVAVLTRLVVQTRQERDAIDKALKQSRVSEATLRATARVVDTVRVTSSDTVRVNVAGDRSATFDVRAEPYTMHAVATLPSRGTATLDSLRIRLDTAVISARLGCADRADANGIRAAMLTLRAPQWLTVTSSEVSQDPSVCANASRDVVVERRAWYRPLVSAGYGATYDISKRAVVHGPTVVFGWRLLF